MEPDNGPGLGPSLSPFGGKTERRGQIERESAQLEGLTSLFSVLSSDFPTKPPEKSILRVLD